MRTPLLTKDTIPASLVPPGQLKPGTRVNIDHGKLPYASLSDVLAVSGGQGASGWRVECDYRDPAKNYDVVWLIGTCPRGQEKRLPISDTKFAVEKDAELVRPAA